MVKSSPWPKLLPPLGIVLALLLIATAASVWLGGGPVGGAPTDGSVSRLIALTQATRAQLRAAVGGDASSFDQLAQGRTELAQLRESAAGDPGAPAAARRLAADPAWSDVTANL